MPMTRVCRRSLALAAVMAALLVWGAGASRAGVITSYSPVTSGGSLIDFENLPSGTLVGNQYAGVTFSQNGGGQYPNAGRPMIDTYPYLFGYGASSGSHVLTGSTEGGAPFPTVQGIVASFSSLQKSVEIFLSDTAPLGDYPVSFFGNGGVLLGTVTIPGNQVTPPGYTGGPRPPPGTFPLPGIFISLTDSTADIQSIQVGPSTAFADAFAVDDLRFGGAATATPEPASLTLLGMGCLALAGYSRRRRVA